MKRLPPFLGLALLLCTEACHKPEPKNLGDAGPQGDDATPVKAWALGESIAFQLTTAATEPGSDAPYAGVQSYVIALDAETKIVIKDMGFSSSCTDGFDAPLLLVKKGEETEAYALSTASKSEEAGLMAPGQNSVDFMFSGQAACSFDVKATLAKAEEVATDDGGVDAKADDGGATDTQADGDSTNGGDTSGDGGGGDGTVDGAVDAGDDSGDGGGDDGVPVPLPTVDAAQVGHWRNARMESGYPVVGNWTIRADATASQKIDAAGNLVLDADYLLFTDKTSIPAHVRMVVTNVRKAFVAEPVFVGQERYCSYGFDSLGDLQLLCRSYLDPIWPTDLTGAETYKIPVSIAFSTPTK